MSGTNRFAKLAEKTTEVFRDFSKVVQEHRGELLTATAGAVFAGLMLYEPSANAHPLLVAGHEAAHLAHETYDVLEQAGATETLKTLAEFAVKGYLTPVFTTEKGIRMLAVSPLDALVGVKDVLARGADAVRDLLDRGLAHLQRAPAPAANDAAAGGLDLTQPLYDSDGFEHHLVTANSRQVVTVVKGAYGVWDRKTGGCLIEGCLDSTLSNNPPDPAWLADRRFQAATTLAELHAQAAIERARSSPADDADAAPM